jgi:tetratricopeptide (TPR) repeat protein
LAFAVRELGDLQRARALYRESLEIFRTYGDKWVLAYLLEDVGMLAVAEGEYERALRLVGAGAALREEIGAPPSPVEAARLDELLAPARAALDQAAQNNALALGRSLDMARAIEYALAQ